MVYCSNCRAANQSGHHCSHCGAPLGPGGGHSPGPQHSSGPKYVEKTCLRCNGTGSEILGGKCKGCGGAGAVLVKPPPRICGNCNGTGAGDYGATTKCSVCGGCGWLNAKRLI